MLTITGMRLIPLKTIIHRLGYGKNPKDICRAMQQLNRHIQRYPERVRDHVRPVALHLLRSKDEQVVRHALGLAWTCRNLEWGDEEFRRNLLAMEKKARKRANL